MSAIKKPIEANYMVVKIDLDYGDSLVLPYKEGITLLASLENTKIYNSKYGEDSKISNIKYDTIKSSSIGAQEYGEAVLRNTLLAEAPSS